MWQPHLCCCLLQGASATSNSRENVMSAFSASASPMSHGPASHSPRGGRGECSSTRSVREDTTTPAKCLIPSLSSPTLVSELSLSGKASYCRSPKWLTDCLFGSSSSLFLSLTHSLFPLSLSLSLPIFFPNSSDRGPSPSLVPNKYTCELIENRKRKNLAPCILVYNEPFVRKNKPRKLTIVLFPAHCAVTKQLWS